MKKDSVSALLAAKLKESGLTAAQGRKLCFRTVSSKTIAARSDQFEERGGFEIPYFRATGKVDRSYYRFRYLEAPQQSSFASAQRKTRRYVQLRDTPPRAYLAPFVNWRTVSKTASTNVFITEGELKAAKATSLGYPTIGLGGVYSFRSAKLGLRFLPELADFDWSGRSVFIVYDSDVSTKPDVRRALAELAHVLVGQGAVPYEIKLPDLPNCDKTGLDDFFVRLGKKGKERFEDLVEEAEPLSGAVELWRMNDEVVFVEQTSSVFELAKGFNLSLHNFKNGNYAHRQHVEKTTEADGRVKLKEKQTAIEWLRWPHRRSVRSIVFEPDEEYPVTASGELNLFKGFPCTPRAGSIGPYRRLVEHLFDKDREKIRWFERWVAYPLQHPGAKLASAVVLWGIQQGTGKSLLGQVVGGLYGDAFREIDSEVLQGTYNDWSKDALFVLGDEITGGDRRASGELVKRLITRHKVIVREKYVVGYEVRDHTNYYFTSNHPDPFYIEASDRRFFIHEVTAGKLPRDFYKGFDAWLNASDGALYHYFLNLDISGMDRFDEALETEDKRSMVELSASDVEAFLLHIQRDFRGSFAELKIEEPCEVWTAAELLNVYNPELRGRVSTVNGMARALTRAGFQLVGGRYGMVQTKFGGRRLYALANQEKWAKARPKDIADHYNKHHDVDTGATKKGRF